MATILPYQQSPAPKWRPHDFRQINKFTPNAAPNVAITLAFPTVPDNELWILERAFFSVDAGTSTDGGRCVSMSLHVGDDPATARNFRWYQPTDEDGYIDLVTFDPNQPIKVFPGEALIVRWAGMSVGGIGVANTQWTILRKNR